MEYSISGSFPPVNTRFRYLLILLVLSFFYIHGSICGKAYAEEAFYSIQLATFDNLENAKKKVDELKELGHNSFYRTDTLEGNEGKVYRVFIERYSQRSEAESEARVMKELELISDYRIAEIKEEREKEETKEETGKQPQPAEPEQAQEEPYENGYLLQIGSYREKENVEELILKVKDSGHSAFYREKVLKDQGKIYRVYIGGLQSEAEARKVGKGLMESGLISDYLLKAPGEKSQTLISGKGDLKEHYFLHVSSYKEKANAEENVRFLKDSGLMAFLVDEEVSGERWFRVYIGEFDSEELARKTGSELLEEGVISYFKPLKIKGEGNSR